MLPLMGGFTSPQHGTERRVAKRPRCEEKCALPKSGQPPSPFSQAVGLVYARRAGGLHKRGLLNMRVVIDDAVLFCCMGALLTGIVVAAAALLS